MVIEPSQGEAGFPTGFSNLSDSSQRARETESLATPPTDDDYADAAAGELDVDLHAPRVDDQPGTAALKLERRGITSQPELWQVGLIWLESVCTKLHEAGRADLAAPLDKCHTERWVAECTNCSNTRVFWNRCDKFYCPACTPRLARERRESIEWWVKQVTQPKHVVLTVRNSAAITKATVQHLKACFARLRRSKFASGWRGGFYSVEVTNEQRGWHIHIHALVDARWIDSGELAKTWARIVGQSFAIVKVKDCRNKSYLQEVTKYAVKGSELAAWAPADVAAFVDAFTGVRTFGVFGTLYGKRTEWREWLDSLREHGPSCSCGCTEFRVFDENEWAWHCATSPVAGPNAPPVQTPAVHQVNPAQLVLC